jgi:hypothetical protein
MFASSLISSHIFMIWYSPAIAANVYGLVMGWHSIFFSPERQPIVQGLLPDKKKR